MISIFDHPAWYATQLRSRLDDAPAIWEIRGSGQQFAHWPRPGFFLIRNIVGRGPKGQKIYGPKLPALIYRPCPWVEPDPRYDEGSAHPADWCRPTERPRPLCAMLNGSECREGREFGDPISGVEYIWRWGEPVTAAEYEAALRRMPDDVTRGLDELPSLV